MACCVHVRVADRRRPDVHGLLRADHVLARRCPARMGGDHRSVLALWMAIGPGGRTYGCARCGPVATSPADRLDALHSAAGPFLRSRARNAVTAAQYSARSRDALAVEGAGAVSTRCCRGDLTPVRR